MIRTSLTMLISLVLLATLATTPIMITEDAFARYQRHTGGDLSQAASITNTCLNPASNSNTNDNMISNGNCGGTISQQGRSGQSSSPTTVQNANPSIEVQRSTTPGLGATPPTTGTLTIKNVCDKSIAPNGVCPVGPEFDFNITDGAGKMYHLFFAGIGSQFQSININPGEFRILESTQLTNIAVSYSGGCTGGGPPPGHGVGNGTISAGQTVTCVATQSAQ